MSSERLTWELLWAPYDEPTYQAVLSFFRPEDVVLEIGAGDLRLARKMAKIVRKVVAIEFHPELVQLQDDDPQYPDNLIVQVGDARYLPFPEDLTAATLLMRHCNHFRLYADRLKQQGCQRLITNARWRMNIECIDLQAERLQYAQMEMGWWACWCGAVGFKPGLADKITAELFTQQAEVIACPECQPAGSISGAAQLEQTNLHPRRLEQPLHADFILSTTLLKTRRE